MMAAAMLLMVSCGQKAADNNEPAAAQKANATGDYKIAYVEIDTIATQYQLNKDYEAVFKMEQANIEKALIEKQRTLQSHMAAYQKKVEENQFTTKSEVERAQAVLGKEQQDYQEFEARLANEFAKKQADYNKELQDSVEAFIKVFNKDGKYDFILSKQGNSMLYANPAYDITNDIVKGLNDRYKATPEMAEKLKKAKEAESK